MIPLHGDIDMTTALVVSPWKEIQIYIEILCVGIWVNFVFLNSVCPKFVEHASVIYSALNKDYMVPYIFEADDRFQMSIGWHINI